MKGTTEVDDYPTSTILRPHRRERRRRQMHTHHHHHAVTTRRRHHLLKTFWGWRDQQLRDGTVTT